VYRSGGSPRAVNLPGVPGGGGRAAAVTSETV
jgi:hypothetical protein